jgi:hypothetical protein
MSCGMCIVARIQHRDRANPVSTENVSRGRAEWYDGGTAAQRRNEEIHYNGDIYQEEESYFSTAKRLRLAAIPIAAPGTAHSTRTTVPLQAIGAVFVHLGNFITNSMSSPRSGRKSQ